MEPFNIKINHNQQEITLTILPEKDYFKIVYFGAIVGAIKQLDHDWELVAEDEIEPGILPLYDYKQSYSDDQPKVVLNLPEINQIAGEIENVIY
ncbi:hypothetical protein FA048_07065 [Pedobacter polaris]|uniref:Uncharacterized protein n=1 Tax=Pedobacter polaris TaxID=2571273 RepID=A0A4U1CQL6_9SPHI|nr:hypothetical protein [Pedobacter polaris]TKC09964.1 hypothetical protein FA048_07065 [Pedobacter polaris]